MPATSLVLAIPRRYAVVTTPSTFSHTGAHPVRLLFSWSRFAANQRRPRYAVRVSRRAHGSHTKGSLRSQVGTSLLKIRFLEFRVYRLGKMFCDYHHDH